MILPLFVIFQISTADLPERDTPNEERHYAYSDDLIDVYEFHEHEACPKCECPTFMQLMNNKENRDLYNWLYR